MDILILGAGDIGYHIAIAVSKEGREVVMIDSDLRRVERIEEEENDIQIIHGNAADPEVLIAAGLLQANLLIAVSSSDENNIAACFLASRLAPNVHRVARIRQLNPRVHGHLLTDDPPLIHSIINPEELCARKIIDLIRYPGCTEINWFFNGLVALVGIPVDTDSPLKGKSLLEIGRGRGVSGLPFLVAMIVREGKGQVPLAKDVLQEDDLLYLVTLADRLDDVLNLFCADRKRRKMTKVAIFGGGNIGLYLAEVLEKECSDLRIVEQDEKRAAFLADRLRKALVLCGEPFERNVFPAEEIATMDAFVAATEDQEDNMIAALHAKSHGARFGVSVIYREQMAELAERVGVDAIVMPRQVAIGTILEHIRAGEVSSVTVLNQSDMEVLEIKVPDGARIADRPLHEIKMPQGTLLLALQRGDGSMIIPDGETTIMAGDSIAIISRRRELAKIEKMLAGKFTWPWSS